MLELFEVGIAHAKDAGHEHKDEEPKELVRGHALELEMATDKIEIRTGPKSTTLKGRCEAVNRFAATRTRAVEAMRGAAATRETLTRERSWS